MQFRWSPKLRAMPTCLCHLPALTFGVWRRDVPPITQLKIQRKMMTCYPLQVSHTKTTDHSSSPAMSVASAQPRTEQWGVTDRSSSQGSSRTQQGLGMCLGPGSAPCLDSVSPSYTQLRVPPPHPPRPAVTEEDTAGLVEKA